ncbi:GSCFA domain-containing protein [Cohaesibacter haloalkalitolerans]|uniref:GSCFA domain-containing protein n=1 Tax=Cohaesibacter haloalkalitolerans TaxID=1162980 RepID=UPI000E64C4A5|nr:GSCFA domain-containing protein [Cohaesibacter haloalkalitolerans]
MTNPYHKIASFQLWRRAVSRVEPFDINPAVNPRFQISSTDRVATAGSCFAQHISRRIAKIGFNYYCPEHDDSLSAEEAVKQNYGVFSARYGNIYTVQQLNQLFGEAVLGKEKHESVWKKGDAFFDPYRPNIFPQGFATELAVKEERGRHLACVRQIFEQSDIFVFTLGLTEGWRSQVDGSVFPLAPGVAAGSFDSALHEFHNFTIDETRSELFEFLTNLKRFNPGVRVLLTVSPVPLIATFEDRHVLTSTVYSKSVLRVAAQEAYDAFPFVDYFPSYEIITGSPTCGMYFEDDMREINARGVSHAMRCFMAAYASAEGTPAPATSEADEQYFSDQKKASEIVCDEEEIEKSLVSKLKFWGK